MERILGTETIERTVLTKESVNTEEGDKELNQQRRDCFTEQDGVWMMECSCDPYTSSVG